jgi:hypothetical protein
VESDDIEPPPVGGSSIRFGSAIMQPTKEKDHYGLYRPVVVVRNDGGQITREQLERPVGPLAVYRTMRKGDKDPGAVGSLPGVIITSDPMTKQPMRLMLVWRPGMAGGEEFK